LLYGHLESGNRCRQTGIRDFYNKEFAVRCLQWI